MDILSKVGAWLDGKKTYLISILIGGFGIYLATGTVEHPHVVAEWVWAILGALGLGAVRSGIGNTPPK